MGKIKIIAFVLLLSMVFGVVSANAETKWEPKGVVTIIAAAAPGSGFDTSARNIAKVLNETGIVKPSIKVLNQPGGSGAVATSQYNQRYGKSGETLMVVSVATIAQAIANDWEVTYKDFTHLAALVTDYEVVVCNKGNEKYDTIEKIIEALKADPKSVKIGGGNPPDPDYIGMVMLLQEVGVDTGSIEYAVYDGGGELIPALMGNHIDVAFSTASEWSAAVEAGQLHPVVVFSPERMGGVFAEVPTLLESGIDVVFGNWRGVWGGKDMPEEAITFWRNALKQMSETEQWAEACNNLQWTPNTMFDDFSPWLDEFYADTEKSLKESGIID